MHTHAQEIRLKVSLNEYIMHHPPIGLFRIKHY